MIVQLCGKVVVTSNHSVTRKCPICYHVLIPATCILTLLLLSTKYFHTKLRFGRPGGKGSVMPPYPDDDPGDGDGVVESDDSAIAST